MVTEQWNKYKRENKSVLVLTITKPQKMSDTLPSHYFDGFSGQCRFRLVSILLTLILVGSGTELPEM